MKNFWLKLKKPIKILAPMEDVTDTVFRQLLVKWGRPDVFFTEFTNASGLGSEGKNSVIHRFKYTEVERPIVAQIWGIDAEMHYKSAKMAKDLGFDGVDINMGCPVKKIIKKGACSALIDNPKLAGELIQATKEGAKNIPVSVKTRIGFNEVKTEEWAEFLLSQNIQTLTVHGRTSKQLSKVPADWREIEKVVNLRDKLKKETIIIGNGDVKNLEEIEEKHNKYKVDGVMVGRGIFEDVFLFNPKKSVNDLDTNERLKLLIEHIELFDKTWGNEKSFNLLKRYFKFYIKGFNNASDLRTELVKAKTVEELLKILRKKVS